MIALGPLLLLLHAAAVPPVLELPEPGLDDTSAYQGYRTRIFRDSHDNAVQVYLERKSGRAVLVWADAADESAAFTARDSSGAAVEMTWGSPDAEVSESGGRRSVSYRLRFPGEPATLGHFALGTMRWERDLQYQGRHLAPFDSTLPPVPELAELLQGLARLDGVERARHLKLLADTSLESLRSRLHPVARLLRGDSAWIVRVEQPSFDGKNQLVLELRGSAKTSSVEPGQSTIVIRPRAAVPFTLAVTVTTDAAPLTPIDRNRIFTPGFLAFCTRVQRQGPASRRARRLERELRGMELVSYEEKLMAGLPNFATYFGRDMMMTALMMANIWRPAMLEHVIASALRKLSPAGEASHEEALGGQAIRENAGEYAGLLARAERAAPAIRDSLLARAGDVLEHLGRVRENYRMVDETFQLPVVAARYLARPDVPAAAKRTFLLTPAGTEEPATRLEALLRNLDFVAASAAPYAGSPEPTNLVAFHDDPAGGFVSGSWRDSGAGYAGGRFAMDVNVVWAPEALRGIETALASLRALGFTADTLLALSPRAAGGALARYLRDPAALRSAREAWSGARRWFEVTLAAPQVRDRIAAWLAWLPETERAYWRAVADTAEVPDRLRFLALSLDRSGQPIPVMNSDPASLLFVAEQDAEAASDWIEPLLRSFPVGLFVPGLGVLASNDVYATRDVWESFRADSYHSLRVVWGREVNLLLLGLARQIRRVTETPAARSVAAGAARAGERPATRAARLRRDIERVRGAAAASGLEYSELWSYRIERGALRPARFGASSDVQLWSLTDLAVQYALDAQRATR